MNDGQSDVNVTKQDLDTWYDDETESDESESGQIAEYDITASPNDFNVKTIVDFIKSGAVKIPGFQRNYVWDKIRASKFIESLIIGLPIPQIFLYEQSKRHFLVIDGQQRLMSIYYFIEQRFPIKERRGLLRKIFANEGIIPDKILHDDHYFEKFNLRLPAKLPDRPNKLHGLNYSTLGENKIAFDLRPIRNIIIKQNFPRDDDSSMYEIFNRLNTGGVNLSPQEIRTSLFHSEFYEMLYRINYRKMWRRILGISEPDLHIKDIEFLLRGFAILIDGDGYKPSMTRFLNKFSTNCKTIDQDRVNYLEAIFDSFLEACSDLPDFPFHKKGRFMISLYEAVFYAACKDAFENRNTSIEKIVTAKLEELKSDQSFIDASSSETASATNVKKRRDLALSILKPVRQ